MKAPALTRARHANPTAASLPFGIAGAAALAATSAVVDSTGQNLRGSGGFDDGATPRRTYFPYDMAAPKRE